MNPFDCVSLLIERYPELSSQREHIISAYEVLKHSFSNGGKLLIAGNGGSAADAEHIVGELMKGFENRRKVPQKYKDELINVDCELGSELSESLQMGLPAIALGGHTALTTASMNDCNPLLCFAQQLNGYGTTKDVFLAISTSGNSKNILYAATVARAKGMKVIGLTGASDSKLSDMADITIRSSQERTFMVQEHHLPIYHCLCLMLEEYFFGANKHG